MTFTHARPLFLYACGDLPAYPLTHKSRGGIQGHKPGRGGVKPCGGRGRDGKRGAMGSASDCLTFLCPVPFFLLVLIPHTQNMPNRNEAGKHGHGGMAAPAEHSAWGGIAVVLLLSTPPSTTPPSRDWLQADDDARIDLAGERMTKSGLGDFAKMCGVRQCHLSSELRTAGTRCEEIDSKSKTIPGTWCAAGVRCNSSIGSALFQDRGVPGTTPDSGALTLPSFLSSPSHRIRQSSTCFFSCMGRVGSVSR